MNDALGVPAWNYNASKAYRWSNYQARCFFNASLSSGDYFQETILGVCIYVCMYVGGLMGEYDCGFGGNGKLVDSISLSLTYIFMPCHKLNNFNRAAPRLQQVASHALQPPGPPDPAPHAPHREVHGLAGRLGGALYY